VNILVLIRGKLDSNFGEGSLIKRKTRRRKTDMNIDLIFRIAAIGILVSVLNALLNKSGREEQAMMTTLAGLVVVLMMIVKEIANLFDAVKTLFQF
jgi:stage III sporulation protein AC